MSRSKRLPVRDEQRAKIEVRHTGEMAALANQAAVVRGVPTRTVRTKPGFVQAPAAAGDPEVTRSHGAPSERTLTLADFPDVGRVEEVAALLRCSKWCVYDLINTGTLKSIRLGWAIRVTRRCLEEFLSI